MVVRYVIAIGTINRNNVKTFVFAKSCGENSSDQKLCRLLATFENPF